MDERTTALGNWLKRLERRSSLSADERAAVLALSGRLVVFGTSRDIVKLGQRTTHSCLIVSGVAARFGQNSDGLRQLSAIYLPGDMADLHSAVLPRVSAPLQSALQASVLQIPHSEIIDIGERYPRLARAFWRDCVVDAQVASEWLLNVGRRDARARLAHTLCELATRYAMIGYDRDAFPLEVTQNHLADATGMTAVHVNRSMRALREAGAIEVRGRQAVVLDWGTLAQIADFDPAYLHIEA